LPNAQIAILFRHLTVIRRADASLMDLKSAGLRGIPSFRVIRAAHGGADSAR